MARAIQRIDRDGSNVAEMTMLPLVVKASFVLMDYSYATKNSNQGGPTISRRGVCLHSQTTKVILCRPSLCDCFQEV